VDPFYLAWKAKMTGFEPRFIELAGHVNGQMPYYVVERINETLNAIGKPLRGTPILALGAAYKKSVSDVRESPALDVMRLLREKGAEVSYCDPHVPRARLNGEVLEARPLNAEILRSHAITVILTDHDEFDFDLVVREAPLVFDTRNALKEKSGDHIHRL
jgi:UDP-N-acetyl-D-glucosamine dehydrogenase